MSDDYPKRDPFFSHKFVRLLQKGCVAQDIGRDATLLLCFIVHQEDAAKYSKPVRFWNEQLMNTMGFKSPKQLNNARDSAIKAGWLRYFRTGNRQVGSYFVTIPTEFEGFPDSPIEHNHSIIHSADGINTERIAERIGDELRNEKVTESGKHSIPIPIPIPNPVDSSAMETSHEPPILEFETVGGIKTWSLEQSFVDEMATAYPDLDIVGECRKAKLWIAGDSKHRKTANGMRRFLIGWLSRSQNNGKATANGHSKPSPEIKIVSLPTVNPKHLAEQQRLDREAAEKAKSQQ